ncbi:MAG: AMP-binding protein [Chloroflexota bacterium]
MRKSRWQENPDSFPPEAPYSEYADFSARTIPALFLERCQKTPDKIAFRVKDLGIYREVKWQEYREKVESFCLGLLELGLKPGEKVAIMGDPCPEWLYADLATQSAGGISYGIYPTSSVSEVKYLIQHGEARFLVAEDQEYVDKVLAVIDELPALEKIIVVDTRVMFVYQDPRIVAFSQIEDLGMVAKTKNSGLFQDLVSRVRPEVTATLVYTSGTTGPPKAAMISHYNLLWGFFGVITIYPDVLLNNKTRTVAYLPLSHILARLQDAYLPLICGYITHFGESPETMAQTVFEVAPDFLWGAPRVYAKLASQLVALVHASSYLKRQAYDMAMRIGRRYIRKVWEGRVPWHLWLRYKLAYLAVFRPLLDKVGFRRIKFALVAAAPVPPEVVALWQTWGVNLLESYGGTEFGNGSYQWEAFSRPGNAGPPAPRVKYCISGEGELLLSSPGVFRGYYKNKEATEDYLEGGWAHTGDIVEILEDGSIKIRDRIKDVIKTAGGKGVSPSEIEKALKASHYVEEVIVIGHGRKYISALVEIDFNSVSEWARSRGIVYSSYTSLGGHPEVNKLIAGEIAEKSRGLSRVERPKTFRILPKELDPEDETDPVTATRKIQRQRIGEKFHELIESMYDEEQEKAILEAEVSGVSKS